MATIDDAIRLIDRCVDLVADTSVRTDMLEYAGKRAGVKAEEAARVYPAASGKPLTPYYERVGKDGTVRLSKFKSLKQQRKVIMLGKAGRIPYPRSGELARSITSDAEGNPTGVVIKVGSNDPKARYVLGDKGEQSHYHEGTWLALRRRIDAGLGDILDEFQASLLSGMRRYLRGGR